jgi:PQQ-dependent catabolism-associated CXXCW motif protein
MGGDAALRLRQLALARCAAFAARPPIQLRLSSLSLAKPSHPSPTRGEGSFWKALRTAALLLLLSACAQTQDTVPEPAGFWTGPMGGDVPATISGGTVVDTAELAALIAAQQPVLVDVGPQPHKPDNIAADQWTPPPHRTIPGSAWLPGVGAGELAVPMDQWYRARLEQLTGGDRGKPLVVFCHPNCWGSWNAAKRAILYGYTDVHWYEEGIEGWQEAGHETHVVEPQVPPS